MATISIILKKSKTNSKGEHPVVLRLADNTNKRAYFSTGFSSTEKQFDTSCGRFVQGRGHGSFNVQRKEEGGGDYNGKETVLPYVPLIFGKKITPEGTFGFFDIDFDGKDELVYAAYTQGYHGRTAFRVFELDGTERDDEPFDWNIDEVTEFNRSEKSITIFRDGDWDGGDVLKYRLQSDGAFHVTDSTHILYKHSEDIVTDSIRFHYRKRGDKMVLVKKEVVR